MRPHRKEKFKGKRSSPLTSSILFMSSADWWHNACLNFMGIDINAYAVGYKRAADFLVERVSQERRHQDTLVYPIAFLYRQYLELRLKELIHNGNMLLDIPLMEKNLHHGIDKLWEQCRDILEKIHPNENTEGYNQILCMKGKSVSYVDLPNSTRTRRGPKGYAHGQAYWKSGRRSNDFGIGVGFRPTPS